MQRETSESAPVRRIRTPQTSPPDDLVDLFSLSLYNLSSGQQGIEIPVELNGTSSN